MTKKQKLHLLNLGSVKTIGFPFDSKLEKQVNKVLREAIELYRELLRIPKRAIETLEVGDYVEYTYQNLVMKDVIQNRVHIEKVRESKVEIIKIIPHEVIEIIKGAINNE